MVSKKKTHVLTLSKNYPAGHPRAKEKTNFRKLFENDIKIHTFRTSYHYWKRRIEDVQDKTAVLSVREWSGVPYNSSQDTISDLADVHCQSFYFDALGHLYIDEKKASVLLSEVAKNDGFNDSFDGVKDMCKWFGLGKGEVVSGIIIHFTPFRY